MSESAKAVQARAVEWIVQRQTAESWSEEDQVSLDAWLNESSEHLLAYWRAEDGWKRTELLGALRSFRPQTRQNTERSARIVWARRAAVAAVVTVTGIFAANYFAETPQPSDFTYSTVVGEHKTLALADGSQIEMNTDTVLRASKRKVVLLKGEAYFQIKHDAAHPFMVYASGHRIVDLGTKFVVKTRPDRIEVALVEGSARVDSDSTKGSRHSALLKPGDVAVATATSISVTKKTAPVLAKELAWRHGNLIFDNTALADVAAEFNRYNRQKIVITDPKVARLTIVGTFPANDEDAIVNTAREVFGLHTEQKNDRILISR